MAAEAMRICTCTKEWADFIHGTWLACLPPEYNLRPGGNRKDKKGLRNGHCAPLYSEVSYV